MIHDFRISSPIKINKPVLQHVHIVPHPKSDTWYFNPCIDHLRKLRLVPINITLYNIIIPHDDKFLSFINQLKLKGYIPY
jgi:hypothetical protein